MFRGERGKKKVPRVSTGERRGENQRTAQQTTLKEPHLPLVDYSIENIDHQPTTMLAVTTALYTVHIWKRYENTERERELTQNGHGDSFTNGRRDTVRRDAIVDAHMTFGHVGDPQCLPFDDVDGRCPAVLVAFIPQGSSSVCSQTQKHYPLNMQTHLDKAEDFPIEICIYSDSHFWGRRVGWGGGRGRLPSSTWSSAPDCLLLRMSTWALRSPGREFRQVSFHRLCPAVRWRQGKLPIYNNATWF